MNKELPEVMKELTKIQPDTMAFRQLSEGYKHCNYYITGNKCTLGNNITCDKHCKKIQVSSLYLTFYLLRCRSYHFGMLYIIAAHTQRDDPFAVLAKNCQHKGCTQNWKIKEKKAIKKHEVLAGYLVHLYKQWNTPKAILLEIYYTHIFYHSSLFPLLKEKGFSNIEITQFLAKKSQTIEKIAAGFIKAIIDERIAKPIDEWLEEINNR